MYKRITKYTKRKRKNKHKSIIAYILCAVTVINLFPSAYLAKAAEDASLALEGTNLISGYSVDWKKNIQDYGNDTFAVSLTASASDKFEDKNTNSKQGKDGYYTIKQSGYYLIELFGGAGGKGENSYTSGGKGGSAGYVYGKIYLEKGQTIAYSLGGNGGTTSVPDSIGGANGDGGGHGSNGSIGIGTGGGYSSVFLFNENEFETKYMQGASPNYKFSYADQNSKYILIAAGGGGGGAGNSTLLSAKGTADGGAGGNIISSLSGAVSGGEYPVNGTFYAGLNGKSSGTSLKYIGHGGTNLPGKIAESLAWYAGQQPNDWMGTYNENLLGGAGGSGDLRGGAGGSGFCGGSGGIMTGVLAGSNVGGGGGGSSFVAELAGNSLTSAESSNLSGSNKSTTGGYIAVTLLKDNVAAVSDAAVGGTISQYFDILSVSSSQAGAHTSYLPNGDFTVSALDFTPSNDTENPNEVTVTVVVRAKKDFAGGNNVPIFASNFEMRFDPGNILSIDESQDTDFANVSLNFELVTNNYMTSVPGTAFSVSSLYNDSYVSVRDNLSSHWQYDFIESISLYTVYDGAGAVSAATVAPQETTSYSVNYIVNPKNNGKAAVGQVVKQTTLAGVATITVVEPGAGVLGDKSVVTTKTLTYSGGVYDLSLRVRASISKQNVEPELFTSTKSHSIPETGWYAIQARGGNGGKGGNASALAGGSGKEGTATGGDGGMGGYAISWYYFKKGDVVNINIGSNGLQGSNASDSGSNASAGGGGGYGGSATSITYAGAPVAIGGGGSGGGGGAAAKGVTGTVIALDNGKSGATPSGYSSTPYTGIAESGKAGMPTAGGTFTRPSAVGGNGGAASSNYSVNPTSAGITNTSAVNKYNSLVNSLNVNTAVITHLSIADENELKQELSGIDVNGTISRYFEIDADSAVNATSYSFNSYDSGYNKGFSFSDIDYGFTTETVGNIMTVSTDFTVSLQLKPKEGFLGGNDVPVLVYTSAQDTGLSLTDGENTLQIESVNETDFANVSLADVIDRNFTTTDRTIYYGNSVLLTELYTLAQIDGTSDWRADFADLVVPIDEMHTPTQTTVYPITVELAPKTTGEKATVIAPVSKTSITKDATVYVRFAVTSNLTNLVTNGLQYVLSGQQYTAVLSPSQGYKLPQSITVTVDGVRISTHNYSYNKDTGSITIPADSINGNVVITANADIITYNLNYVYQNYVDGEYVTQTYTQPYPTGAEIDYTFINSFTPNELPGFNYYWDWGGEPLTHMPAQDFWVTGSYVPIQYTLTINYTGTPQSIEPHIQTLSYGQIYSVVSPLVSGYMPDKQVVSGILWQDTTVTVSYTPTANELNIIYLFSDSNQTAAPAYRQSYTTDESYAVNSPAVEGYTPSEAVVSGVMTADGYSTVVYYTPNQYEVSFDANGGSVALQKQNVVYGSIYAYNGEEYAGLPTPIKPGYTFDGWYMGGENITNDTVVSTNGDHTLVAKWTSSKFTLTVKYIYDSDETKAADDYTAVVDYNTTYTAPVPHIDGYTTQPLTINGTMPAANLVLFVRYMPDDFTLTVVYRYEDGSQAAPTHTEQVRYKDGYSVVSPLVFGFEANMAVVSGIMPGEDFTRTVTYYELLTVEVEVEWSNLDYNFERRDWNPQTHNYENNVFVPTQTDANRISITNYSNIPVRCALNYTSASGYEGVSGSFVDSGNSAINYIDFDKGSVTPQQKDTYLNLAGSMPLAAKQNQSYTAGTVRVTVLGDEVLEP